MRRGSGRIIGGLVAALALVAVPTGASAEISVDPAFTILYVKGDDGPNQIAVECRDGLVTVNDSPAADGQASCADLEKLRVFGFGGDDTITLSGFAASLGGQSSDAFGGYGTQPEFSVSGGDGNDILRGDATEEIFNTLAGGRGRDRLRGGPGRDKEFQGGLPHRGRHHLPGFAQILGGSHQVVSVSSRLLKRLAR